MSGARPAGKSPAKKKAAKKAASKRPVSDNADGRSAGDSSVASGKGRVSLKARKDNLKQQISREMTIEEIDGDDVEDGVPLTREQLREKARERQ